VWHAHPRVVDPGGSRNAGSGNSGPFPRTAYAPCLGIEAAHSGAACPKTKPSNPMTSSSDSSNSNNNSTHESGALAAWGFIAGCLIGSIVGIFTGYWVLVGLISGTLLYIAGACIERFRR